MLSNNDAIQLIETILKSLRNDPAQFQFSVNVTTVGAMSIGGGGGAGIVGIGGGPGSIGFSAAASAPSQMTIDIAKQNATKEMNSQVNKIVLILQQIVDELRAKTITKGKKENFLAQLSNTLLPEALKNVISVILGDLLGSQT